MQERFDGVDISRIEHVTGLGPAAARGPDAVASGVERLGRVSVGVDRNCAAGLYDGPDRLAGEIDADLHEGTNDRLHVSHLLANLAE